MEDSRLLGLISSFRGKTITVLGDYILDQYTIGQTERVSREAPVIVIRYTGSRYYPGGAANAARNVVSLGARVLAMGSLGEDREGEVLFELLKKNGIDVSGVFRSHCVGTAVKERIMAGELHAQKQQVARVDRSCQLEPRDPVFESLGAFLREALPESDALLISDYGMGLVPGPLSEAAIRLSVSRKIPVVIDSRFHVLDYKGATVATPNEIEVFEALGLRERDGVDLGEVCEKLRSEGGLDAVIVTRGNLGMFICESNGARASIGVVGSREATDVTGAGDTVAATVALSLASGASLREAAEMATYAAAVVVMKRGTADVSPWELEGLVSKYPRV